MYGVPKFRENFFMKYKKEVLLSVGAVITIATVVRFVPGQDASKTQEDNLSNAIVIEEVKPIIGYRIVINGAEVGVIADEASIDDLVNKAYNKLVKEIGYDPEITVKPALIPTSDGELTLDTSDIIEGLKSELYYTLGDVKQKAYVMRIGDDFTVALESIEAVKQVLCNAQEKIINTDMAFEIDFDNNEHNSMVMTPKVLMIEPEEATLNLSTAAGEAAEVTIKEEKAVEIENAEDEDEDEENAEDAVDSDIEEEPVDNGVLKEIEFAEDIAIVEVFVDPSELVDVETATELITKENEEEKIYFVESGDSPWLIANQNDMSLKDLYKMNPGLEEQEKSIHIGDEVIIMVPEPELKVETKIEIIYSEPIYRETTYVKDANTYVGRQTVIDNGSDGVMEITAILTKLNGEEIEREIINKEKLVDPVNKIVSKGSKPFPVKGATGSYIFPVSGYVITSPFGYRWGSFHHGVDLALATGNPVVAADGGTIIFAGWKNTYGYMVDIDHGNGVTTRYAHNSKILVSVGQAVSKGEDIAEVGSTGRSTGPHVHFEIRFDGVAANPMNYLE